MRKLKQRNVYENNLIPSDATEIIDNNKLSDGDMGPSN